VSPVETIKNLEGAISQQPGAAYTTEQYNKLGSFDHGFEDFSAAEWQNGQTEMSNIHWPNSCHRDLQSDGINWIVFRKQLSDVIARILVTTSVPEVQELLGQFYVAFRRVRNANGQILIRDCALGLLEKLKKIDNQNFVNAKIGLGNTKSLLQNLYSSSKSP